MSKIRKFIKDVAEEQKGFKFAKPKRLDEEKLTVAVPVINKKLNGSRNYITIAEANDIKIEDTGMIDYIYIKNNEDKPVYIARGEIFKGKTQERAVIHSNIIDSGKGRRVAVRCVHQSKGINRGSEMKYSNNSVSYNVDLSSQGKTWETISTNNSNTYANDTWINASEEKFKWEFNTSSWDSSLNYYSSGNAELGNSISTDSNGNMIRNDDPNRVTDPNIKETDIDYTNDNIGISNNISDDLLQGIENVSNIMEQAIKNLKLIDNQVGYIFINDNKILGLDIYNSSISWKEVHDSIKRKGVFDASVSDDEENANLFEFKEENAPKFINKKLMNESFTIKTVYDKEYQVYNLIGDNLNGECIVYNDSVLHLSMWNNK